MYSLKISSKVDKIFYKLSKKNPKQLKIIYKKIKEIANNPHHYKNLRHPLQNWKRVHIDNSFVLCFAVNDNEESITLENYEHHDKVYR